MFKNKIYIENDFGFFIGFFKDNTYHKHYAIQISIAANDSLIITNQDEVEFKNSNCLIKSNVSHKLSCKENQLLILVNPSSSFGHYLTQGISDDIGVFNHPLSDRLKNYVQQYNDKTIDINLFNEQVKKSIQSFNCACNDFNHFNDKRIYNALAYIEANYDRVVSLKEVAATCHLSPSRFLHLFKDKTGITFRRAQLWIKIAKSFKSLPKQSITETAHQYGFTDSAHYSKIFKQNFGFSPKMFLKK